MSDEKVVDGIRSLALERKDKKIATPLTIVNSNLEIRRECYCFFEQELGSAQFYPPCKSGHLIVTSCNRP